MTTTTPPTLRYQEHRSLAARGGYSVPEEELAAAKDLVKGCEVEFYDRAHSRDWITRTLAANPKRVAGKRNWVWLAWVEGGGVPVEATRLLEVVSWPHGDQAPEQGRERTIRLPVGPLVAFVEARCLPVLAGLPGGGVVGYMGEGSSAHRSYLRAKAKGYITLQAADTLCSDTLGVNPSAIWPRAYPRALGMQLKTPTGYPVTRMDRAWDRVTERYGGYVMVLARFRPRPKRTLQVAAEPHHLRHPGMDGDPEARRRWEARHRSVA
jgi:hypothetical protein